MVRNTISCEVRGIRNRRRQSSVGSYSCRIGRGGVSPKETKGGLKQKKKPGKRDCRRGRPPSLQGRTSLSPSVRKGNGLSVGGGGGGVVMGLHPTKPFFLRRFRGTGGEWASVQNQTNRIDYAGGSSRLYGRSRSSGGEKFPVVNVSEEEKIFPFIDSVSEPSTGRGDFCLQRETGLKVRIP